MQHYYIFSDASVAPQQEIAVGAYLILTTKEHKSLSLEKKDSLKEKLTQKINYFEFKSKKSTFSEITCFIKILNTHFLNSKENIKITLLTDCQSLKDLIEKRQDKLIKNDFKNKKGEDLNNKDLYKKLFLICAGLNLKIIKIKGHSKAEMKENINDEIFSFIDKGARKKLRNLKENFKS